MTNNVVMLTVQHVAGRFNKMHDSPAAGPFHTKNKWAFQKGQAEWWRECSRLGGARMSHYKQGYQCNFVIFSTKGDIGLCHRVPRNIPHRENL